jgi:hypothetical protein
MRDCGWTIKVTKLEESEYDLEEDEYTDYEFEMKRAREGGRGVGGGILQEKTRSLLEERFGLRLNIQ